MTQPTPHCTTSLVECDMLIQARANVQEYSNGEVLYVYSYSYDFEIDRSAGLLHEVE